MVMATFRLKTPIFATFAGIAGPHREEAIRYLSICSPVPANDTDPAGRQPLNSPEKAAHFMSMLDMEGRDTTDLPRFFLFADLDSAVEDAYRAARWRALDFIWGKNQLDDPAAPCPRSFDAQSEAEAKARMIAAVGFDFTWEDDSEDEEA